MTMFEEFAIEVLGKVEIGENGLYKGYTNSLAIITNNIILSDDDEIFNLSWEDQKEIIKNEFYRIFPYLKK